MLHLLPTPAVVEYTAGSFVLPAMPRVCIPVQCDARVSRVLHELFPGLHRICCRETQPDVRLETTTGPAESYELTITPAGLRIAAPDAAGFFYALQTLRQIMAQAGVELPGLRVADAPVFTCHGY